MLTLFASFTGILMLALLAIYYSRFRHIQHDEYVTQAAWLRAGIFFCACYLVSWATGTMESIVSTPIVTADQMTNSSWQMWLLGMTFFILFAYWGIWTRFTIRFDREKEPLPQIAFGLVWGTAFGQLFLSIWHITEMIGPGWSTWQIYLCCLTVIAIFQSLLMSMYWDLYISPEHDTRYSIILKVITTHTPNIALSLLFFALYENHVIFIALQTLGLVGCSLGMRMPTPWSTKAQVPPRHGHSVFFGLPYCEGYLSPDPKNDPYLRAAHLPC